MRLFTMFALAASLSFGAEKYTGPVPEKDDVPYLLHADNLVELDVLDAKEEDRKDTTVASIPGPAAKARTPLAEPIFIFRSSKITPDKIQAYKLDVKNGNREVVVNAKKSKNITKPIHLNVTRLSDGLYKIEVDEELENGEYCLSPDGENRTFSFQIY
jgi:hypothetical protein